jgi:fatty-acyl-CoA synthase
MTDNSNPYQDHLDKHSANFTALSPMTFMDRAAKLYPERTAVVHGDTRRNWAQTYQRCQQMASALSKYGIGKGHTVSLIAPNIPEHFAFCRAYVRCSAQLH